jgi:hypothetical protein
MPLPKTTQNISKRLIGLMALLVIVLTYYLLPSYNSETFTDLTPKINQEDYNKAVLAILKMRISDGMGKRDATQSIMEFVHDYSIHKIDDQFYRNVKRLDLVMIKMAEALQGKHRDLPHLSCGPRATLMKELLSHLGIKSRLVQVYSDSFPNVEGHRLLEVLNSETARYELWDPDFRVWYQKVNGKDHVDAITMVLAPSMDLFEPTDSVRTGWEDTQTKHLRDSYFKAVLYEGEREGMRHAPIFVNTERFDVKKRFADGLNFSEWATKKYGDIRFIPVYNLLNYR